MKKGWTIVCVYAAGKDFKPEYVDRLVHNLRRCFPQAEGRVLCLTDRVEEVLKCCGPDLDLFLEPLVCGRAGWWNKLEAFRDDITAVYGGPFLYMDLDMVPMQPFTLPEPAPGEFFMWKDRIWFTRNGGYNSSIMVWKGDYSFLFEHFTEELEKLFERSGDQEYIRRAIQAHKEPVLKVVPVDDLIKIADYKLDLLAGTKAAPASAQVIAFHGQPRPWDVKDTWLKEAYWHGCSSH